MTEVSAEKGTISVRLVGEALRQWRAQGRDAAELLAQAGIATELLERPNARVSAQAYARLWRALAQAMDDEFFGMNVRRLKSGSFAFMARTAAREPTLGAALDSVLSFLVLVFDGLAPRLERQDGLAAVVIEEPPGQACPAFGCFTLWMIVHGLACWLLGRRIPILAVDLRCPAPDYIEDYRVMFSSNLRFARGHSRLLFNADCLDQPVRRSDRELRRFLAGAPANILVRYRDPQSHAARVKAYLRSLKVGRWPDFETLAGHFFMAPSTLRRRLAQEGQSYRGLKDQLRRDLALARLSGGDGNFAELALELGFADASAFYKAFKKWTGTTPGQYHGLMHPEPTPGN
ncbi:AraC family transcriptional regulator [Pseudomonas sp. MBLB4136]|uniref:AraC family transcriptional regulator n=1 Tax=Pseudomonas sp. MBLB4136 TaxID=3451558 RepID=UPI003F756D2C